LHKSPATLKWKLADFSKNFELFLLGFGSCQTNGVVMWVLFIDDDQDDYELFCEALKELTPEANCLHKRDGKAALNFLLRQPLTDLPDYIFLDINMPGMSGKECLERIKSVAHLKDIPVIIFSTSIHPDDAKTYAGLGAIGSIRKPYTYDGILQVMKELTGSGIQ
jgi:CheY-like chemotaxis protein